MHGAGRACAILLLLAAGGCAEMSQMFCRDEAERAGDLVGTRHAGTSCHSSSNSSRDGRNRSSSSNCTPRYENVYQWTPNSDRVYARCMASTAAQYGTPAPVPAGRGGWSGQPSGTSAISVQGTPAAGRGAVLDGETKR